MKTTLDFNFDLYQHGYWIVDTPSLLLFYVFYSGFAIGGDSPVQHLVLQVHYINVQLLPEHGDISGVDILYTDTG